MKISFVMSNFNQRIKQARLEAGLSQEALAQAMGRLFDKKSISRTAITQWESSKTSGIEAANLLKAAKILNVTPDWLQFGHGSMRPIDLSGLNIKSRFVPLLSHAQAVNHLEKDKEIISTIELDEQLAKVAGHSSFALTIKDNSMLPLFTVGDLIIIDPSIVPSPGEFIVGKLKDHHSVVFRKYRPFSGNGIDHFELVALNEDWGKIKVSHKAQFEIIGSLIEHRCKRRLEAVLLT
jgi:SOS-response transcriptional repressor LexA